MSDFDDIKEELSIVNGSFVTLGDPLKYDDKTIHIRDTMLLAPGRSKSLASIGIYMVKVWIKLALERIG